MLVEQIRFSGFTWLKYLAIHAPPGLMNQEFSLDKIDGIIHTSTTAF